MTATLGPLIRVDDGATVVDTLELADSFWSRFRGLQLRPPLPEGHGILLVPCASIHTFWMRFPIDVAFLGDGGAVLQVERAVSPWRVLKPRLKGVRAVLEVRAGEMLLRTGERIQLLCNERLPASLCWLDRH
ncbi:MAG: DUF192 domain-containing protein [Planctomycetaceae bacterium]